MAPLALATLLLFSRAQARMWIERVESAANPSDVLSRAGWQDPEVAAAVASGRWQLAHLTSGALLGQLCRFCSERALGCTGALGTCLAARSINIAQLGLARACTLFACHCVS